MRGGALPPALLFAALGLLIAFAPRRTMFAALAALLVAAVAASLLPLDAITVEIVFAGLWISVAATAAAIHLRVPPPYVIALAVNAGGWGGAAVAAAGVSADLWRALPAALVALPAAWLVAKGGGIAVKIASSWLIAVAILAGTLPLVPTPGYIEDHRG